ncbi:hypothetical protein JIG36_01335 [Actinoplanes sp. LDG1-06]|uniref:ABC transporter permease n=1 Tax=Paractinoplanes ovalisporus TaxID=2810368 RepID=A0ABS2A2X5_9ACTN|nr:hypothetical protein [Actinoplanes ovalisporus]MBM2614197.1 hypothetical protein [Actinoplanes ovalisporus]
MNPALLYLRSRRVPLALSVAIGGVTVIWTLWLIFSTERDAGGLTVVLTVVLMVGVLSTTLAAPDESLERTASIRWPWRRVAHLLGVLAVVLGVLLATLVTGARFGPAVLVLRDAAGLAGLTALGACLVGAARSWFLPVGWTVVAAIFPQPTSLAGALATWQAQPPGNRPAAYLAAAFAVAGLVAWAVAGARNRDDV